MNKEIHEAVRSAFGIGGTSAPSVAIGSVEDLMDAFRRFSAKKCSDYSFEEFKSFVNAVQTNAPDVAGLEHFAQLLNTYAQRVPDLGWERCVRQVWPLLRECKRWVEDRGIPIEKIGVRPCFQAVEGDVLGAYEMRAFLCNHSGGFCDCDTHG